MIQRTINAYSPAAAVNLTVQAVSIQIGTGASVSPYDEVIIYNPTTMASGIPLAFPIAPGTRPQVFLKGLHMVTRAPGASTGGDVSFSTTLEGVSTILFVGDTYLVSSGDEVHVVYWKPA